MLSSGHIAIVVFDTITIARKPESERSRAKNVPRWTKAYAIPLQNNKSYEVTRKVENGAGHISKECGA